MASLQQFPVFLREHGLIRLDDLPSPEPTLIKRLPAESALHFLGSDDAPSIDPSNPLMLGYPSAVRHMDIVKYPVGVSGGTHKPVLISQISSGFDRMNRGFKYVKEIADLRPIPSGQLMVLNYGYLDQAYRYPEVASSEYIRFENKLKTVISTIKSIEATNSRNHFLVLDVPANLVPKSLLDKNFGTDKLKLVHAFPGADEQLLRQLWTFLIPPEKNKDGTFSKVFGTVSVFDDLTDKELRKVNLLFRSYDGKYTCINLGYLYSWVRGNQNLTFMKTVSMKDYVDVQRYLLRGMMVMQTINATGASEAAKEEALRQQAAEQEAQARAEAEEEVSEKDERFLQDQEHKATALRDKSELSEASPVLGADGTRTTSEIQDAQRKDARADLVAEEPTVDEQSVNADLEALEKVYQSQQLTKEARTKAKKLNEEAMEPIDTQPEPTEGYTSESTMSPEEIKDKFFTHKSTEDILVAQLDKMAEDGRVTATEYRKRLEMIKNTGTILDPYGSGKPISQAQIVTKEELAISNEEAQLNVPATVIDKSMARSSLNVIARKYNTQTLYKDMLGMVQGIQAGGVVIKDYRIERRSEITGDYDVHTLELVPLSGSPSIISFRTPRVYEDGTFIAKNTKYAMRKQMVD